MDNLEIIETNIFNNKFAKILISNEQEQFNFLKVYPLFKRKQNLLLMWKQHYENTTDNNHKSLMIKFIVLALNNDLIEYKTNDILTIIDEFNGTENKELIKKSIIDGKTKTCINKISLIDDPHILASNINNNIKELNFKDFAYELTRICAHLITKITYHELLFVAQHNNSFHKNENELITPIELLIDHFHKLNYIVLHSILIEDKNEHDRIETIKHIFKICEELKILNNYHGLFALIAGLNNSSIQKLNNLWSNQKYKNTFSEFSEIINPIRNYKTYRDNISRINSKNINRQGSNNIIPYIGITISDLIHVLECPLYDIPNNSINMDLYNILLTIIDNFKNIQMNYNIEKNNAIYKWISNIKIVYSDTYFYDISNNIKLNNKIIQTNSNDKLLIENKNKVNIHKQLLEQLQNSESSMSEIIIRDKTHDSVEEVIKLTDSACEDSQNILTERSQVILNIPEYKKRNKHKSMPPLKNHKNETSPSKIKHTNNNLKDIKSWTVLDVQHWLYTINMETYCDLFMQEDIDGIALYNLTNEYLKTDLHITKLGHRLKILDSIRTIKNS